MSEPVNPNLHLMDKVEIAASEELMAVLDRGNISAKTVGKYFTDKLLQPYSGSNGKMPAKTAFGSAYVRFFLAERTWLLHTQLKDGRPEKMSNKRIANYINSYIGDNNGRNPDFKGLKALDGKSIHEALSENVDLQDLCNRVLDEYKEHLASEINNK